MKFECDSCHAQYMIADEKVGKRGVKVKCKKCQHVIIVRPDKSAGAKSDEKPAEEPKPKKPKMEPVVEKPAPTMASSGPPGLDVDMSGPDHAASDENAFATGGPTDPSVPTMPAQREPPPAPPSDDSPFSDERGAENTGPGLKPAPVSMFGDQTQLTNNPMGGMGGMSEEDEPRNDRTELAAPPQMSVPAPMAPPPMAPPAPMGGNDATHVGNAPPPPPPPPLEGAAPEGTASMEDLLSDQLSGAFNSMFSAPDPNVTQEEDHRGPTKVLDVGEMDQLRKRAAKSVDSGDPLAAARKELGDEMDGGGGFASSANGADDGPAEAVWHVAIDDQEVGPLSLAEIGRHIESGRVDRDSLVWKIGMDDWIPAGEVPEVRALFDKVPLPRIKVEEHKESKGGSPFDESGPDNGAPPSPFDESSNDDSWRPHGLTAVYQAANLAEVAGAGGGAMGVASTPPRASAAPLSSSPEPEWRPQAASALASLVQDEIKRLDSPPPASDDGLMPADDASLNAPIFGGLATPGKDLDAGPEISDPMSSRPRTPSGGFGPSALDPPPLAPSFPPAPAFQSRAPEQSRGLTPPMIAGIAIAGVLLLGIIILVVVLVTREPAGPKIILVEGKPYVMDDATGKLVPVGGDSGDKGEDKGDGKVAANDTKPADVKPADGKPVDGAPTPPTDGEKAAAPSPLAEGGDKVAAAATQAPAADDKPTAPKVERKAAPPKPKERVEEKPPPPPRPTKGCDPVLDFDCDKKVVDKPTASSSLPESPAKSDVLVAVKGVLPKVAGCGSKHKATGTIAMQWTISPSGKATDIKVTDKNAGQPVAQCVTDAMRGVKFPASQKGVPKVNFPLKLD